MQETAYIPTPEHIPAPITEPIVLNPGISTESKSSIKKNGRGALATLGILLAGWFFGNLILLAVASTGIAVAAGSTGLVKVPLVTERFFGTPAAPKTEIDQSALANAEEKLNTISTLSEGETLKSVALAEDEVNALFQKQVTGSGFPIVNPKMVLGEDTFVFTGNLASTNAPVEIKGEIDVSGLVLSVDLTSAKFGKVEIPSFIATNLIDSYLSEIGLSLSGSQIPAKSVKVSSGLVSLLEVSKNN